MAVNQAGGDLDARSLRKACIKALKSEGVRRDAVLSVSALKGEEMEELNRRYLDREGQTDVIAFPMGEESGEGFLLGDVVICPEYIAGRSKEYDVEEGRELEFVAVHGILHLLGYDDRDEEGALKMERRQREILGLPEG